MMITLPPELEAWLQAHVAAGDYSSVEEAARQIIADRMAQSALESDNMEWAKPLVDEARAGIARGEVITVEEHKARNAARLAALREK
jgi:antitoxin ParD1/3/4